jgi:DNA-binding HxlR family transcriptional regulator
VKRTSFADMPCSIARALDLVGEWWSLLIIRDVFNGVRRFDDLLSHLGISRNVLTDRLNALVENGILKRHRYQERPPRYDYRLTEKGLDLWPVLVSIMSWGDKWLPDEQGPPVILIHKHCDSPAAPAMVCTACGETLGVGHLKPHIHSGRQAPG